MHRFLIVLTGTDPVIWRRIEVPEAYSFWDLHVANPATVKFDDPKKRWNKPFEGRG